LIENARRYGRSADGVLRLSLSLHTEGSNLIIDVTDQGKGIAEQDVPRLLRPFSRGETARTGVSGAGLGLAIVERLLKHVDGHLILMPQTGSGLTARIVIPKAKSKSYQSDSDNT